MKTFFLRLEDDLHTSLKIAAAGEHRTMNELLIDLIEKKYGNVK